MKNDDLKGKVFNIQRFSTDDGSGIRTCVFLKGCPLRCPWCHNAESLSFKTELAFYEQNCIKCGACISACPSQAIDMKHGKIEINRTHCLACGRCACVCFTEALVTVGKDMTVKEVMEVVERDVPFYKENGGITITGGEPMAQAEFVLALAKATKKQNISVTIETSGCGRTDDFLAILPYCDLFLFDCKASSEQHSKLIGIDDHLILKNLDTLSLNGAHIILRCPIVKGANLEDTFIQKIAGLAKKHSAIQSVQLMPYHKTGTGKSAILGKEAQPVFQTPTKEELSLIAQRIEFECRKPVLYN